LLYLLRNKWSLIGRRTHNNSLVAPMEIVEIGDAPNF
jgi:hypothetical protein